MTDGNFLFWINGREAALDTGDSAVKRCRVTDRG